MRGWAEAVNIRFTVHMGIQAFRNYQRCTGSSTSPAAPKEGRGGRLQQEEFVKNPPADGCWWSVPSNPVWVIKWNQFPSIQRTENPSGDRTLAPQHQSAWPSSDVTARQDFTARTCLTWCEWFHWYHANRDDLVFFPSSWSAWVPWEMSQSRESCYLVTGITSFTSPWDTYAGKRE